MIRQSNSLSQRKINNWKLVVHPFSFIGLDFSPEKVFNKVFIAGFMLDSYKHKDTDIDIDAIKVLLKFTRFLNLHLPAKLTGNQGISDSVNSPFKGSSH